MKRGVTRRYRKKNRKAVEPNCIICSPELRGYRLKYKPKERAKLEGQP